MIIHGCTSFRGQKVQIIFVDYEALKLILFWGMFCGHSTLGLLGEVTKLKNKPENLENYICKISV